MLCDAVVTYVIQPDKNVLQVCVTDPVRADNASCIGTMTNQGVVLSG